MHVCTVSELNDVTSARYANDWFLEQLYLSLSPAWQRALLLITAPCWPICPMREAGFTKYLTTILRLSFDNAKVMIDLRRTTSYEKHKAFLAYSLFAKS